MEGAFLTDVGRLRVVAKSGIASEEAGVQGAASPLPEREERCLGDRVQEPSPPPLSLPPQAATQDFATTLGEVTQYIDKWNKSSV